MLKLSNFANSIEHQLWVKLRSIPIAIFCAGCRIKICNAWDQNTETNAVDPPLIPAAILYILYIVNWIMDQIIWNSLSLQACVNIVIKVCFPCAPEWKIKEDNDWRKRWNQEKIWLDSREGVLLERKRQEEGWVLGFFLHTVHWQKWDQTRPVATLLAGGNSWCSARWWVFTIKQHWV